jgi:hypothetical protein
MSPVSIAQIVLFFPNPLAVSSNLLAVEIFWFPETLVLFPLSFRVLVCLICCHNYSIVTVPFMEFGFQKEP